MWPFKFKPIEPEKKETHQIYNRHFKYDPTSLPKEFHNKNLSEFIEGYALPPTFGEEIFSKMFCGLCYNKKETMVFPTQKNIAFVITEILIRICAFLAPKDFLNFSLTCRFLHWRIFTFCRCYISKTKISIKDLGTEVGEEWNLEILPKWLNGFANPHEFKHLRFNVVVLTVHEDNEAEELLEEVGKRLIPFRNKIDKISVIRRAYYELDYSLWNDFLRIIKADSFQSKNELALQNHRDCMATCMPAFFVQPYVSRMTYLQLGIHGLQDYDFKEFQLTNPFGTFVGFPPAFVKREVLRFALGNYDGFRCHRYVIDEQDDIPIARLMGLFPCIDEKTPVAFIVSKEKEIVFYEETRTIVLCNGRDSLDKNYGFAKDYSDLY